MRAKIAASVIFFLALRLSSNDSAAVSAKLLTNGFAIKNYWDLVKGESHLPGKLFFNERHTNKLDTRKLSGTSSKRSRDTFLTDRIIGRNAIRDPKRLWPNGTVPFVISNHYGKLDRMIIATAMRDFREHTCVRFAPRTSETNYINITHTGNGCYSRIGMTGGGQIVSLDRNRCLLTKLTPTHELMHALGFYHEHARHDRDRHVDINHDNVMQGEAHNFEKQARHHVQLLGTPYDHSSVMHYLANDFAIDAKRPTITRKNGSTKLGNSYGMTEDDILKINRLYRCHANDTCWDDDVTGCRYLLKKHGPTLCTSNREEMARDCQRSCRFCTKVTIKPKVDKLKPDEP